MQTLATITCVPKIRSADAERMLALHCRYYDQVQRETFLGDLSEKDWAILLRDPAGEIAGFSTLQLLALEIDGMGHRFLFSGDTVVGEKHRMSPALAGSFGHVLIRLMEQCGETNLYWFLISKGFRTYRFLPVFFHRFFPVFDQPTPAPVARLLDAVAHHKFGRQYDAASGIIRPGGDRLNPRAAAVPDYRKKDPHVEFFLRRNPGCGRGDELACLAAITRRNLNRFAWRVINQTPVTWDE